MKKPSPFPQPSTLYVPLPLLVRVDPALLVLDHDRRLQQEVVGGRASCVSGPPGSIRHRLVSPAKWSNHEARVRRPTGSDVVLLPQKQSEFSKIPSCQNSCLKLHGSSNVKFGNLNVVTGYIWKYSKLSAFLSSFPNGL